MLADVIRQLRNKKGISQAELATHLGVAQQTVGKWEKNIVCPSLDTLKNIADFFGVTTDDLLERTSEDKKKIEDIAREVVAQEISKHLQNADTPKFEKLLGTFKLNETNYVPVIGSVRCGPNGLAYQFIDEYVAIDDKFRPDEIRAFRAVGNSMEGDGIKEGDICLVHLQEEVPDGSIAVVVINGEEGTMKHYHKGKGFILLQSSNPEYPPRVFSGEEMNTIKVVGKVVQVRHDF